MNAYLCNYRVRSENGKREFDVIDLLFSTSFPSNVGHYWVSLHNMEVVKIYSVELKPVLENAYFCAKTYNYSYK